jgi:hypothetical protein
MNEDLTQNEKTITKFGLENERLKSQNTSFLHEISEFERVSDVKNEQQKAPVDMSRIQTLMNELNGNMKEKQAFVKLTSVVRGYLGEYKWIMCVVFHLFVSVTFFFSYFRSSQTPQDQDL